MSSIPEVSRRGFLATAGVASAASVIATRPAAASSTDSPTTVRVSDYGHNLTDDTAFLQAALDSGANTVIIDKVPGGWLTGPLHLDDTSNINPAGLHIIIEPGVTVRALPGAYEAVRVVDRTMFLITKNPYPVRITGYGATFEMNKPEYVAYIHSLPNPTSIATAEAHLAMGVTLDGAKDVTIEGLTIRDTGGDGLNVAYGPPAAYSQNITFRDVTCVDCFRNAMSVSSVDGLTVDGCAFLNTNGTSPQAGVDLEPNSYNKNGRLANIVFRDCVMIDNLTAGMYVSPHNLNGITTTPISVLVERVTIGAQVGGAPSLTVQGLPDQLGGSVEFRDCLLNVSPGSAAFKVQGKSATSGPSLALTNVSIWDEGNSFQVFEPIQIKSGGNAKDEQSIYGGVTFNDCVLVTDQPEPFLRAHPLNDSDVLSTVNGTITVADPYGVSADYGTDPTNVTLKIRVEKPGKPALVRVHAVKGAVRGGEDAQVTFSRVGGDLSAPLAIVYQTAGSARERYDYGGLGKVAVIPPGRRDVTLTIPTYARRQDSDPRTRSLLVAIAQGYRYEPEPGPAAHILIDS